MHARRGFSLVQVIVTMTLLSLLCMLAIALSARLLRTATQVQTTAELHQTLSRLAIQWRADMHRAQLRNADENGQQLTLQLANQQRIVWTCRDGAIERIVEQPLPTALERYRLPGVASRCEVARQLVTLHLEPAALAPPPLAALLPIVAHCPREIAE